jgi:hypothetical protein
MSQSKKHLPPVILTILGVSMVTKCGSRRGTLLGLGSRTRKIMTPVDQASTVDSCRYPRKLARSHRRVGALGYGRGDGVPYARRSSAIMTGASAIGLLVSLVVLLVFAWRGESWAYIDPNAGGFLSQILVPLGSIFLSFLFYCRKEIRRFVKSARDRWKRIGSRDAPHKAGK